MVLTKVKVDADKLESGNRSRANKIQVLFLSVRKKPQDNK